MCYFYLVLCNKLINFADCRNVLLLNSFLKKDTKQYKAEIKKAGNIVKRYLED